MKHRDSLKISRRWGVIVELRGGRSIISSDDLSHHLGRISFAWAVLLGWAGMVLPNLDSHTRAHPVAKAIIAVVYSMLVIGNPIALATCFNRAWQRVATVPNRTAYVIWMSLESIAGAGLLGILAYATVSFAMVHFG